MTLPRSFVKSLIGRALQASKLGFLCPIGLVCTGLLLVSGFHAAAVYVNFEGKQTSPIRLSPDGTRLFAVNTPDARLSVFDVTQPSNPRLIAEIPVGVEPVSVNPRNNDEVWVVNEVSDSISVVSVSQRMVTDAIYVKDEPADVVFAGGNAFISASPPPSSHQEFCMRPLRPNGTAQPKANVGSFAHM